MYGSVASSWWDWKYIRSLITNVLQSVVESQDGILRVGSLEIPVPPSDIRECIHVNLWRHMIFLFGKLDIEKFGKLVTQVYFSQNPLNMYHGLKKRQVDSYQPKMVSVCKAVLIENGMMLCELTQYNNNHIFFN